MLMEAPPLSNRGTKFCLFCFGQTTWKGTQKPTFEKARLNSHQMQFLPVPMGQPF